MLEFSKKQVKGLLDIIKGQPNNMRPALQTLRIRRDGYLYATDGYVMVRAKMTTAPEPKDDKVPDICIPLHKLEVWYKLAKSKDKLRELDLISPDLADDPETTDIPQYPDVEKLWGRYDQPRERGAIFVDTSLLGKASAVIGETQVKVEFLGELLDKDNKYYVAKMSNPNSGIEAIIMPLVEDK